MFNRLADEWDKEIANVPKDADGKPVSKPSLIRALWKAIDVGLIPYWIVQMIEELSRVTSPIFLALLVQSLSECTNEPIVCPNNTFYNNSNITNTTFVVDCATAETTTSAWRPWVYGFALTAVFVNVWMLHHIGFWGMWRTGMHLRVATTLFIFNKALSLDLQAMQHVSVGHVVNLASSDVEKFQPVMFVFSSC